MSLWSDYYKERLGFETIEVEGGFICYDIRPPNVSIEDFYVKPDQRGGPLAKRLADQIIQIAREQGCTKVWAKVTPGLIGSDHAMRTNLHYGFKLVGNQGNDTIMVLNLEV